MKAPKETIQRALQRSDRIAAAYHRGLATRADVAEAERLLYVATRRNLLDDERREA